MKHPNLQIVNIRDHNGKLVDTLRIPTHSPKPIKPAWTSDARSHAIPYSPEFEPQNHPMCRCVPSPIKQPRYPAWVAVAFWAAVVVWGFDFWIWVLR